MLDGGTQFPFVFTGQALFPPSGNFSLTFRLRYQSLGPVPSGLVVWSPELPVPLLMVWAGSEVSGVSLFGGLVAFDPGESPHTFQLTYTNGTYSLFVDGLRKASVTGRRYPSWLGIGHPATPIGAADSWSPLEIEYLFTRTPEGRAPPVALPWFGLLLATSTASVVWLAQGSIISNNREGILV